MNIEIRKVADLKPYENNPRDNDAAVEAVAHSIREFGFRQPIVVDADCVIICGHTRYKAALKLGLAEVPVHVARDLTPAKVRAYRLADNSTRDLSGWIDEALAAEVRDLGEIDLSQFGLDVEKILKTEAGTADAEPQVDRAEELNKKWQVKTGDLWQIGEHRLLCGDSTKAEDVGRLMGMDVPFLMVTDPPYGVEYDPSWRNEEAAKGNLAYAARRIGKVQNDNRADWSDAWRLFTGDVIYSWHPPGATSLIHATALQSAGFVIRMQIIWAKSNFPIGRGDYHVRHEPCWYAVRKGKPSRRTDDRTQTTLWQINLDRNVEGGHSTQKPLECMARPIRNHGAPGDVVCDFFLGSGTTMVACQNLGRKCRGIEISPAYCAVILERMATAFPDIPITRIEGA